MDDKRELEDLIEKLNNNINFHKQTQASILFSHGKRAASPSDSLHMKNQSQDLMEQILAEKESYIGKLEQDITEMRKEMDTQRDQFIMNDLGTLNETTTRGGTQYQTMAGGASVGLSALSHYYQSYVPAGASIN